MCPLISIPDSGRRARKTAFAALRCALRNGCEARSPKFSSKNAAPTPSVPPMSRSVLEFQGLPLIISANSVKRTEITLPSCDKPATDSSINFSCAVERSPVAGNSPYARPNAVSTRCACRKGNKSTTAEFTPSKIGISNARIKRVAAIQKSSRTMIIACNRSPSHWRSACTNSLSMSAPLACSHCSN